MPGTQPHPTIFALRAGLACAVCLLVAAWFRLEHANLAVWTSYMSMTRLPVTVFQTGLEKTLGRGVGILAAVVLVGIFPDQPFVRLLIEILLLLILFYIYFSGRYAYAFLNAGLYLGLLVEIGRTEPENISHQGWEMFLAILIGSLISDLVMWITWAERDIHLHTSALPLFPLRNDWLSHAAMVTVTLFLTLLGGRVLGLPINKAIVSVMILTAAADMQAMLLKEELRIEGVIFGACWSLVSFALLSLSPHLSLLTMLLFAGIYVAAYMNRQLGKYVYLGAQMGLVIPLVLVVPPAEFGSLTGALQRLGGVLIAMVSAIVVAGFWPRFPVSPTTGNTATPPVDAKHG
jgi:uncharacterized membrane protein YccC